ncbi:CrcB-like protein-domain-containing protein [Xylaria digitata]|nr:CrcB-like protein-domain-containing protein [Xylaria digitata]
MRTPFGITTGPVATLPGQQQQQQHGTKTRPGLETAAGPAYEVPEPYLNLYELEAVPAIQDRNELSRLDSRSIEELASRLHIDEGNPAQRRNSLIERQQQQQQQQQNGPPIQLPDAEAEMTFSRWTTEFYTVSYLILFAILGTLARLGLQALTFYPGAAIPFSSVWPNFGGTLIIGFLTEDRMLFRHKRVGTPTKMTTDEEAGSPGPLHVAQDVVAAKKADLATKKTIPLYIGLATGFCGSFTSFSSFMRDVFLALSDDLPMPDGASTPRNGGYSFLALLAVIIGTISLSFSGFYLGAHLAEALEPVTPSLRYLLARKVLDPLAVVVGWGSWIGTIILSISPPDRYSNPGPSEFWRGRATFALVFAPLGCLTRLYVSAHFNSRFATFPLGTFIANVAGTAVLGLGWDLAHVPEGGVVGCQVLQGIEDGFCGCLTTVSTWIIELAVLRRRNAYVYGAVSIISGLVFLIAIMGGLRWSQGFSDLLCIH